MSVGIRVGDSNAPKGLAANDARALQRGAVQRLKKLVVFVRIAASVPNEDVLSLTGYDITNEVYTRT